MDATERDVGREGGAGATPPEAAALVDLLAALAGLQHGPREYFTDTRTLVRTSADTPVLLAGAREATIYLLDLSITPELVDLVRTNPLATRIRPGFLPLEQLVDERTCYGFRLGDDGQELVPDTPFFWLLGNSFCTSLSVWMAERILAFMTATATQMKGELASQAGIWGERFGGGVEVGLTRSPTPTLGAYVAHASEIAGYARWMHLSAPAAGTDAPERVPEWYVDLARVERRHDRRTLMAGVGLFTPAQADAALASGVLPILESELSGGTLASYALQGTSRLPRILVGDGSFFWPQEILGRAPAPRGGVVLVDRYYQEFISPDWLSEPEAPVSEARYPDERAFSLLGELGLGDPRGQPWWPQYEKILQWSSKGGRPLYLPDGLPTHVDAGCRSLEETVRGTRVECVTRAKYWRIPLFQATERTQLLDVIDQVRQALPGGKLLFRGQNDHFRVPRDPWAMRVLYGDGEVDELSLTTTASRGSTFPYDTVFPRLQLDLQGLMYADLPTERFGAYDVAEDGTIVYADGEVKRRYDTWRKCGFAWDVTVMGIAQHYGIPTHGLDLTEDVEIAVWMAVNEAFSYPADQETRYWFRPLERGRHQPVIYVVAPINTGLALRERRIPGLESVRQDRQHAHLYFGGWGYHANLCAEEVVAGIVLRPGIASELPTDHVFPGPETDPLYGALLELKALRRGTKAGEGFDRITTWREPVRAR